MSPAQPAKKATPTAQGGAPKKKAPEPAKKPVAKAPEKGDPDYVDPPMTIWEHLAELRKRLVISLVALVVCAGVSWEWREEMLSFMVTPFAEAWRQNNIPGDPSLHFQTPAAAFTAYFKLSLLAGVAMAAPVIFYQLWAFVAPGLYAREKKYVIPFVLVSTALFIGGGYFGMKLAFPVAFQYLLSLSGTLEEVHVNVAPTVMMEEYISFVSWMLLAFGMMFQMPLFLLFLSLVGVVNYLSLIRYARWVVVIIFIVAAIVTPTPDPSSQLLMAGPMLLLYGVGIILAYLFGKPPTDEQRAAYKNRGKKKDEAKA